MDNNLTNRVHWSNYWSNYQFNKIPKKVPFDFLLPQINIKSSFIEIGGFPGTFAAYFHKKGFHQVTLLDFYIDKEMVNKLEEKNDIPKNTIKCIESDFFEFNSNEQFDLVFSSGFIEHFEDTKDVIRRHAQLVNATGQMLIVLPNFRGLNGFIQQTFDRANFEVHNLKSMDLNHLETIMTELGFTKFKIQYTRKPMVWLEPNCGTKWIRSIIKLISYGLKLFPVKCRFLSPYILILGSK